MVTMVYVPYKHEDWGQRVFWFEGNHYGASVICNEGSYGYRLGLFELAVFKRDGDSVDVDYHLCFDTPITADGESGTVGWLTEDQVQEILGRIALLED